MSQEPPRPWWLPEQRLEDLIALLRGDGYEVIGPRIEQHAITYGPVRSAGDLPRGWTDRQEPGSYRLERRSDDAYFGYAVGPHSWKKYLFPPELTLFRARRTETGFSLEPAAAPPPKRAFLGMRACELRALAVQDRVFIDRPGGVTDRHYADARRSVFLIAVECESPAGTCFCASMKTGPAVTPDVPFDLALTELEDGFLLRCGSAAGEQLVDRLGPTPAAADQVAEGRRRVEAAAAAMGRTVEADGLRELLHANQEHPRWDDTAARCLACANCTMVCPTCFCSGVEDTTDLTLESAERVRRWDSCFTPEFARVHGGNYRPSVRARYRQWLTHKFASWVDQFDVSGCVGCGRCITWCPVGIDVTEELTAFRAADGRHQQEGGR